jgi:hypothetical protein
VAPCTDSFPRLLAWRAKHSNEIEIAIISRGDLSQNRAKFGGIPTLEVLLQSNFEIAELYHVRGTPAAVLLQPDGSIGSLVVMGSNESGLVQYVLSLTGADLGCRILAAIPVR